MTTYLLWIILSNVFRLPKKCKYSNNGCDFEQMPSRIQALNDHETECLHRNVKCTNISCKQNVSLSKLSLHLKTVHQDDRPNEIIGGHVYDYILLTNKNLQRKKWAWWASTHFTLNGGREFYSNCIHSPTGHFFLWVYMIGTPKEEEHFTYIVTLFDVNKVIFNVVLLNWFGHLWVL